MPSLTVRANAKLNLTLDVLSRRSDGFHDLRMVMQSVSLSDILTVTAGTGGGLLLSTNLNFLPNNEKNLAAAAALRFQEVSGKNANGVVIHLHKCIPVCAGIGGGSADAAAVLRAMNDLLETGLSPLELARIGELVGSDVPYCALGGTALAEGRGERLTPLPPLPRCEVVLCKPCFSISTPELFGRLDGKKLRNHPDTSGVVAALQVGDLHGVARRMYNIFEDVLPQRQRGEVRSIKNALVQCGALGVNMSGTGPTVFGLFDDKSAAKRAFEMLRDTYHDTFLSVTV